MEKQVSSLVSAISFKRITALLAICLIYTFPAFAQDLPLANGQQYTIGEIDVTGTVSFNDQTVIAYTGLKTGEKIYLPGERISEVLKKLWDLGLFSDINIYITSVEGDTANLLLEVVEVPALKEAKITGVKKTKAYELITENKLTPGTKVNENLLITTKNYIEDTFKEEGYLNTKVHLNTIPVEDTTNANLVNLVVKVDKGERVKIEDIEFTGNDAISDSRVWRAMKNTREERFFRFWKRSKFIPEKYEEDKESIISLY